MEPGTITARAEGDRSEAAEAGAGLEKVFLAHYGRIVKLIARITRDPAGAEELAVEVFLRRPRQKRLADDRADGGWLTRTAVHLALDDVRRRQRRERLAGWAARLGFQTAPSPEELLAAEDQRERVVRTLARLKGRDAELLMLRGEGLSYEELAGALALHPASVGKLISRAQAAFRKEYVRRYGQTT